MDLGSTKGSRQPAQARTELCDAQHVFDDPLAASRPDPNPDEQRWITIGVVGGVTILVVHTWPEPDGNTGQGVGRIISARKATARERKVYEEGTF